MFFTTEDSLVAGDSNGKRDAYVYDRPSDSVRLVSSGKSPANSYFLDASSSGDDVFFITRERLAGWDVDDNYDLYDARVNGGLPDPIAVRGGCSGDACQGPLGSAPAAVTGASATVGGSGNATPHRQNRLKAVARARCARPKVRRKIGGKTRCVSKKRAARLRADAKRKQESK